MNPNAKITAQAFLTFGNLIQEGLPAQEAAWKVQELIVRAGEFSDEFPSRKILVEPDRDLRSSLEAAEHESYGGGSSRTEPAEIGAI